MSVNSKHGATRWRAPVPQRPLPLVRDALRKPDVWIRVGLCLLAILVLWIVTAGWSPAFPYRARRAPLHFPHARVNFEYYDAIETSRALERVRRSALVWYANDQEALNELREALIDRIFHIKNKAWSEVDKKTWAEFLGERFRIDPGTDVMLAGDSEVNGEPNSSDVGDTESTEPSDVGAGLRSASAEELAFRRFCDGLSKDESLDAVKLGVEAALLKYVSTGLLENLEHEFGEGSTVEIKVFPVDKASESRVVDVSEVRIGEIAGEMFNRLRTSLDNQENIADPLFVADRVYDWLRPRLPTTLSLDRVQTERELRNAEATMEPQMRIYPPGSQLDKRTLSVAGAHYIEASQPLGEDDINLLRAEHRAWIASLTFWEHVLYSLSDWGMYIAVFSLVTLYLWYRDRALILDMRQFAFLLALFMSAVIASWLLAINVYWRAEVIPVCMLAITVAIAWNRELSLLLSALVAFVFTVSHGYGFDEFVALSATAFVAGLLCGRIRSRTRLVYIGLVAASVAFPSTIGVGVLTGQPLGGALVLDGVWFAAGALLAGLFMTALLPFLEKWFGLQTDISLLELSDANHPLLKQLVQRAPGTYNHSINVASLAEAAAESIGANGLLCRVAAYFHDIGKMRKPEYFIENQETDDNKHDTLVPTMSTLVIIAHVKDGAEMARRYQLPRPIIDVIEQHHGTTLVEYFYRQAEKISEESGEPGELGEAAFRYPGPKPQTPEAAVMMLADSVESASRTLREPAPARLESLVESISKKKLDDGQFDECALTLQQLRTIEKCLIKSLNAMYHARIQYPDQQPA